MKGTWSWPRQQMAIRMGVQKAAEESMRNHVKTSLSRLIFRHRFQVAWRMAEAKSKEMASRFKRGTGLPPGRAYLALHTHSVS